MNGNEMCIWCHAPLPVQATGRPAQFCGQPCRQAHWRWQQGEETRREGRRAQMALEIERLARAALALAQQLDEPRSQRIADLCLDLAAEYSADPWSVWPAGQTDLPLVTSSSARSPRPDETPEILSPGSQLSKEEREMLKNIAYNRREKSAK